MILESDNILSLKKVPLSFRKGKVFEGREGVKKEIIIKTMHYFRQGGSPKENLKINSWSGHPGKF